MARFSHGLTLGFALLWLVGCGAAPAPPPASPAILAPPRERLGRIVEQYWDEHAALGNGISPQSMADSLALERRFLAEVLAVPRAGLDADSGLTYDIFKRGRELNIEGFTYPDELFPVNPFDSRPQQFATRAAAARQEPLSAPAAYALWLAQIDDYVRWTQQAIANMREGMRRGYTAPRLLVERTLPILEKLGEDVPANPFYTPLQSMPPRLTMDLSGAIKGKLLPATRALHEFMQREYLPRSRATLGLSALPLGQRWYAYRIERAAGLRQTPGEIHSLGLAEVERIRARMQGLLPGPPAAASPAGGDLLARTLAAMPALFSAMPRADFANAPADLAIWSFLQQELPGHHYQSALQQERADLPRFRRFGSDPAFEAGWGLYAASLGEELGLYPDDSAKLGALRGQMRCAVALVVDTGLNAQGWTLAQARDYLRAHMIEDADAQTMIDRYLALPADALACKLGELKIQALRARAQQALGAHFEVREFHSEMLNDGAMPLDILEAKAAIWMEGSR